MLCHDKYSPYPKKSIKICPVCNRGENAALFKFDGIFVARNRNQPEKMDTGFIFVGFNS